MAISDRGTAAKRKLHWLHHTAGVAATTGLLTVGSWLAPRSAQALTADAITPIVLIDQATNLNINPVDPTCTGPLPLREGTPASCPPNFGQGFVSVGTNPTGPGSFNFGYTFDVFSTQAVNALGVYRPEETFDANNVPTLRPIYNYQSDHTVSLFRFTGSDYGAEAGNPAFWSLITSAVQPGITTNSPGGTACTGVVKDLFCWLPVGAVVINPGVYMVSATGGWDVDLFADGGNYIDANPETGWIESVFSPYDPAAATPSNLVATSCYTYPPAGDCVNDAYPLWAANVSTAVPAPLPVVGAAAGFAWTRRLRRRIALSQPQT